MQSRRSQLPWKPDHVKGTAVSNVRKNMHVGHCAVTSCSTPLWSNASNASERARNGSSLSMIWNSEIWSPCPSTIYESSIKNIAERLLILCANTRTASPSFTNINAQFCLALFTLSHCLCHHGCAETIITVHDISWRLKYLGHEPERHAGPSHSARIASSSSEARPGHSAGNSVAQSSELLHSN